MKQLNCKNVIRRLLLPLLLICGLVLSACGATARPAEEIIEELVLTYGMYGEEAADQVDALLKELTRAEPSAGETWKDIMGLWSAVTAGVAVNEGLLPEGLPQTDALCIVALGFQLNEDGTVRPELVNRLQTVLACAEQYPNAYIVCTGGGTAENDPTATEAGRMAEWLFENGVDADRVIVEDRSVTTAQNALYTCELLRNQYPQVTDLAIVSSDYHIATGTLFFGAECLLHSPGLKVVSNAACVAGTGTLSMMFQAGGLIELSGDTETAFEIYYDTYDIHSLPSLD